MDRQAEARLSSEPAGREVLVRGESGFGACKIERDETPIEIGNRGAYDLFGISFVAKSGRDGVQHDPRLTMRCRESVEDRLDRCFAGQTVDHVEARSEADLGVDDSIGSEVDPGLVCDPLNRSLAAHYSNGVRERLEVAFQGAGATLVEPLTQAINICRGQVGVPLSLGKIEDGLDPNPAIEMVMEQGFGERSVIHAAQITRRRRAQDRATILV